MNKALGFTALAVSALFLAACGGGGSTSSPPTSAPTATPTSGPTSVPAVWTFNGPGFGLSPSTGGTTQVVTTYGPVGLQMTYPPNVSGTATLAGGIGFNNGDIVPAAPADNAVPGNIPVLYISYYNPSQTAVNFGNMTQTLVLTNPGGFNGATTMCELDAYVGTPLAWVAVTGASGPILAGTSVTINGITLPGALVMSFPPGQSLQAIACR